MRFGWQHGKLPKGYDHKYTYSHLGYNLKITDLQAAIGLAQLEKLPGFARKRLENWQRLRQELGRLGDYFHLPHHPEAAVPSPFGFALTVRADAGFSRDDLTTHLERHHIQTRTVFAGNMLRQPALTEQKATIRIRDSRLLSSDALSEADYRRLPVTETVMADTFWIGVYPGLRPEMIDYMVETIAAFVRRKSSE
jgi:CDP-6-deoxy-D-xylo-4-hexulose-3-dehydrase